MTRILAAMQTWSLQSSDVLTSCLTLLHDLAQVRQSIAPPIIIFYPLTRPSLSLLAGLLLWPPHRSPRNRQQPAAVAFS
jgi:hypothetical protein